MLCVKSHSSSHQLLVYLRRVITIIPRAIIPQYCRTTMTQVTPHLVRVLLVALHSAQIAMTIPIDSQEKPWLARSLCLQGNCIIFLWICRSMWLINSLHSYYVRYCMFSCAHLIYIVSEALHFLC